MRTWKKVAIGSVLLLIVLLATLAGTGAYFFFRNLEKQSVAEAESITAIDQVNTRFGTRLPLVVIVHPQRGDIRINRVAVASTSRITTIHILNWNKEDGELTRAELPLWLMRFSSVNLASQLGITPENFRLTVSDIQRYGTGIVIDYASPGAVRTLVWVD